MMELVNTSAQEIDSRAHASGFHKQSRRTRGSTKASATREKKSTSPVSPLQLGLDGGLYQLNHSDCRSSSSSPSGGSSTDSADYEDDLCPLNNQPSHCHQAGLLLDCANMIKFKQFLSVSLGKAKALEFSLMKSDLNLRGISYRLFDDGDNPFTSWQNKCSTVLDLVDLALAQAVEFVKTYDFEHDVMREISAGPKGIDARGYMHTIELFEGMKSGNQSKSCLSLHNLQQAVQILSSSFLVDKPWKVRLEKVLRMLQNMEESMKENNETELLERANQNLERLWKTILTHYGMVIPLPVSLPDRRMENAPKPPPPPPPLPPHLILALKDIIDRLSVSGRVAQCLESYGDIRGSRAHESIQTLCPDYLQFSTTASIDSLDWMDLERYIVLWKQHLEVLIKLLLPIECDLCRDIFSSTEVQSSAWKLCLTRVSMHAGLDSFLKFAEAVAKSNHVKEAQKLFKLLDMVDALQVLKPHLEELLDSGKGGNEAIQRVDDVKSWLVRGVSKAFRDFRFGVDLQVCEDVTFDGGVLDLCKVTLTSLSELMSEPYEPILQKAVLLEKCETGDPHDRFKLSDAVLHMLKSLGRRIDGLAKSIKDEALKHLFLLNNYWYIHCCLSKREHLASMLGGDCLKEYMDRVKEHAHGYQREGWASVLQLLKNKKAAAVSPSTERKNNHSSTVQVTLELQKVRAFQVAFEGVYQKHQGWQIPDMELRERMGKAVMRLMVPAYRAYLDGFGTLMRQCKTQVQLKYSVGMIEQMLTSLFQEKLMPSSKDTIVGDGLIKKSKSSNGLNLLLLQDGGLSRSYSTNSLALMGRKANLGMQ